MTFLAQSQRKEMHKGHAIHQKPIDFWGISIYHRIESGSFVLVQRVITLHLALTSSVML